MAQPLLAELAKELTVTSEKVCFVLLVIDTASSDL